MTSEHATLQTQQASGHGHADDGRVHVHALPVSTLLTVFGLLLLLTVVTVGVRMIDIGVMNVWLALLIAVVKAGLVALYFMHLRYDNPYHGVILITSVVFVAIFIGITMLDSKEYQVNLLPPSSSATSTSE